MATGKDKVDLADRVRGRHKRYTATTSRKRNNAGQWDEGENAEFARIYENNGENQSYKNDQNKKQIENAVPPAE